ncbi:MAG: uL15 family ribosomal protein [Nitrososphaerales archaeon]
MASRLRKVRRYRGSRTHGWGQITQHRHSGSRGGTGMAGMHKHKWSYTVKYAPDHFGHNRFAPPNRMITKRWLNLEDLAPLLKQGEKLDLTKLGYDKLLGQGTIAKAVDIVVPRASASAIKKIKQAGGSIVVEVPREEGKDSKPSKNTAQPSAK